MAKTVFHPSSQAPKPDKKQVLYSWRTTHTHQAPQTMNHNYHVIGQWRNNKWKVVSLSSKNITSIQIPEKWFLRPVARANHSYWAYEEEKTNKASILAAFSFQIKTYRRHHSKVLAQQYKRTTCKRISKTNQEFKIAYQKWMVKNKSRAGEEERTFPEPSSHSMKNPRHKITHMRNTKNQFNPKRPPLLRESLLMFVCKVCPANIFTYLTHELIN